MPSGVDSRPAVAALDALLANLVAPAGHRDDAFVRLGELLRQSLIAPDLSDARPRRLSVEPSSWFATGAAPSEGLQLDAQSGVAGPPRFRVYRREAPVSSPVLDLTTPEWGRGAAVAETLGPFASIDGRLFWFDFFPLIRLVPIYLAGDVRPALLFDLHPPGLGHSGSLPVHESLALLVNQPAHLPRGSLWIRADVLASSPPAGTYVGLRIDKAEITFTPPLVVVGGRLTIPAAGHCAVHLNLPPPGHVAGPGGDAGLDAATATLHLPATFSFTVSAGGHAVTQLSNASWTLYDQHVDFHWRKAGPAPWVRAHAELRGHLDVGLGAGG